MNLRDYLALAAILPAVPFSVLADEAADTFNKLYGEDLKRVAATLSPADDVALAKQMLEDAKKAEGQAAVGDVSAAGTTLRQAGVYLETPASAIKVGVDRLGEQSQNVE